MCSEIAWKQSEIKELRWSNGHISIELRDSTAPLVLVTRSLLRLLWRSGAGQQPQVCVTDGLGLGFWAPLPALAVGRARRP